MCSPNRYRFFRSTSTATEQIKIFHEAFFEYRRTRQTDREFPGRYPPPNRYFSNRSRWLLLQATFLTTLDILSGFAESYLMNFFAKL